MSIAAQANAAQTRPVDMRFKCFTAIAIVLVVVGHISSAGFNGPFNLVYPYSYHVAAFAFSAGYFFKIPARGVVFWLKKKCKRFLVPMYGIYLAYALIVELFHGLGFTFGKSLSLHTLLIEPWTCGPQFILNMPMWFIAPFFAAQVVHMFLSKLFVDCGERLGLPWFGLALNVVCSTLLGGIAVELGGPNGLGQGPLVLVCRVMFFQPWLALGRLYKEKLEACDTLHDSVYLLVCLVGELLVQTMYGNSGLYTFGWAKFPNAIVGTYASTVLGIAFLLRVSSILAKAVPEEGLTRVIADNSWSIMCHHYMGFFVLRSLFGAVAAAGIAFSGFDFAQWLSNADYFFYPRGLAIWAFAYTAFGVAFSLGVHWCWLRLKARIALLFNNSKGRATDE